MAKKRETTGGERAVIEHEHSTGLASEQRSEGPPTEHAPVARPEPDEPPLKGVESAGGLDGASGPFEGRWGRLVSTTNWEKGRIIIEWREALLAAGADVLEVTDEAWAQRVGGVTPQHVGRLRRVWERFAEQREQFPGLYWSHFQVALEWDDAEMWLEGAVQSRWSVAAMRRTRWEAQGSSGDAPRENDVDVATLVDEDFINYEQPSSRERSESSESFPDFESRERDDEPTSDASYDETVHEEAGHDAVGATEFAAEEWDAGDGETPREESRQLAGPGLVVPPLPPDLADAFEAFKLGIIRHKLAGWVDISRDDVLKTLDVLRELATRTNEAKG